MIEKKNISTENTVRKYHIFRRVYLIQTLLKSKLDFQ